MTVAKIPNLTINSKNSWFQHTTYSSLFKSPQSFTSLTFLFHFLVDELGRKLYHFNQSALSIISSKLVWMSPKSTYACSSGKQAHPHAHKRKRLVTFVRISPQSPPQKKESDTRCICCSHSLPSLFPQHVFAWHKLFLSFLKDQKNLHLHQYHLQPISSPIVCDYFTFCQSDRQEVLSHYYFSLYFPRKQPGKIYWT